MKDIKLSNGVVIPQLGFGTWQTPSGEVAVNAVKHALEAGYRHIDTAQMYRNEASVGEALVESGIPRNELFITTKLTNQVRGFDEVTEAVEASLENLKTDYIDLFLIHWPNPIKFRENWAEMNAEAWRALEAMVEAKKIRAIGISNFMPHHLEALLASAKIKPTVNQIFLAPGCLQEELVALCRKHDIAIEAYSPLGTGKIFEVELMNEIAAKYNKSVAQVAIRWSLQHDFIPLPKSVTPSRIEENFHVFDFELSDEDMAKIDALDGVVGDQTNPDTAGF
ncbi:2,5-diketo-D-gluconic acid reductase [Erysipelothrix larvae]|uniref:2,5-diketo-D-gluconic acid reductase n=1 Tax=Erysipelothrix larvae TaxID=1514105 RepID=A0A0X8H1D5_9FIRM|nr:aldo/keto reductase [Erysipelothrix larvae]AMC94314.1 2,5-diketo-D-gluconic acid reductase [Erysipelothrix larvae]